MSTLTGIGYTIVGGGVITGFTFAFFAVAVRSRSPNIAPRCTARSKNTIYNPKARRGYRSFFLFGRRDGPNKKMDDHDGEDDHEKTKEEVQYRGGAMFGWIPWTLSLSYDQLLQGVPGTGTRKDGMEGINLRVNLDGIILLRFHALCLRVSILATIIGIGLVLPLNLTARCYNESCDPTDYTLTDYERTTVSNIPSLLDDLIYENASEGSTPNWLYSWIGSSLPHFGSRYNTFLGRLYAAVGFSWVLVGYTLYLMKKEWVDCLALRRVYYLEGMHWENRVAELNQTVLNHEIDDISDDEHEEGERPGAFARRRRINKSREKKKKRKAIVTNQRDPWIPHPEQRETVPNIELYSVLVGNLPSLPSEVTTEGGFESMGFSKKQTLDWQLAVTSTFFDQCVPNQPGFSSSVAAVTILPDAPKLAKAWRTWYRHVGLLRRLRFIQSLIAKRRHYDIDEVDEDSESSSDEESGTAAEYNVPFGDKKSIDFLFPRDSPVKLAVVDDIQSSRSKDNEMRTESQEDHLDVSSPASGEESYDREQEYMNKQLQQRIDYYKDVFGAQIDEEGIEMEKTLLSHALAYGPEQTAVYSREFAQGAAACCPNGCREERLHTKSLKELEELEEDILVAVEESFYDLTEAQDNNMEESIRRPSNQHNEVQSDMKDGGLPNVKSVEELRLPSQYDVEAQLYSRTPTKFFSRDEGHSGPDMPSSENYSNEGLMQRNKRVDKSHPVSFRSPQRSNSKGSEMKAVNLGVSDHESISSRICLTNQGRIYVKDDDASFVTETPLGPRLAGDGIASVRMNDPRPGVLRARSRNNTGMSHLSLPDTADQWEKVQQIIQDDEIHKGVLESDQRDLFSGAWRIPSIKEIWRDIYDKIASLRRRTKEKVEDFSSDSTFAVVTFTSRQAAIAARHCLADGRGADRWAPVEDIPVPPLADAAAFDFKTCRGCCRPVTLTVNSQQQFMRKYTAIVILLVMYVFYTVPLAFISTLVSIDQLQEIFPGLSEMAQNNPFLQKLLEGIVPAALNCLFFALCPVIFKAISNFGSNAISVNEAEFIALQYYWFFMVFTAFSGTSIANMALAYLNARDTDGNTVTSVLFEIGRSLPSKVSANWLNWIILRTTFILPLQYMLQVNTFIFQWLGWKCCRRCVMGGGPGGPVPYRIYIDSGVVFMIIVALAPISPLLAPAALVYFLYCAPLWRRNVIYLYRPKFDTGGLRWPFLSDVLFSSLVVAQILLTTVMALKEAAGPAFLSALPLLPIVMNRRFNHRRYLKSYNDAALLQTSQLDGWDNSIPTSAEKRDEYRKFLVDAHKAAYVPICIAGGSTAALTAEPALVVPHENDVLMPMPLSEIPSSDLDSRGEGIQPLYSIDRSPTPASMPMVTPARFVERAKNQLHASTRRLRTYSQNDYIAHADSFNGFNTENEQQRVH